MEKLLNWIAEYIIITRRAVNQLKSGKAPRGCGIYAEMLRAGEPAALLWVHTLLCSFGTRGSSRPTGDWALSFRSRKARVIPRSVTTKGGLPSSVPGKIVARILLDEVRQMLLTHQHHEQSGFTPKKSIMDRILAIRVLVTDGMTICLTTWYSERLV